MKKERKERKSEKSRSNNRFPNVNLLGYLSPLLVVSSNLTLGLTYVFSVQIDRSEP
jgi:hypothetical protein